MLVGNSKSTLYFYIQQDICTVFQFIVSEMFNDVKVP